MHAKERMAARGIAQDDVESAIRESDSASKKHGKCYYRKSLPRGEIEAVCGKGQNCLKVVTVYWL